jgi:hypothetical protein
LPKANSSKPTILQSKPKDGKLSLELGKNWAVFVCMSFQTLKATLIANVSFYPKILFLSIFQKIVLGLANFLYIFDYQ